MLIFAVSTMYKLWFRIEFEFRVSLHPYNHHLLSRLHPWVNCYKFAIVRACRLQIKPTTHPESYYTRLSKQHPLRCWSPSIPFISAVPKISPPLRQQANAAALKNDRKTGNPATTRAGAWAGWIFESDGWQTHSSSSRAQRRRSRTATDDSS